MSSRSEFAQAVEEAMKATGEIMKTVAAAVGVTTWSLSRAIKGATRMHGKNAKLCTKHLVTCLNRLITDKQREIEALHNAGKQLIRAYNDEYRTEADDG